MVLGEKHGTNYLPYTIITDFLYYPQQTNQFFADASCLVCLFMDNL